MVMPVDDFFIFVKSNQNNYSTFLRKNHFVNLLFRHKNRYFRINMYDQFSVTFRCSMPSDRSHNIIIINKWLVKYKQLLNDTQILVARCFFFERCVDRSFSQRNTFFLRNTLWSVLQWWTQSRPKCVRKRQQSPKGFKFIPPYYLKKKYLNLYHQ